MQLYSRYAAPFVGELASSCAAFFLTWLRYTVAVVCVLAQFSFAAMAGVLSEKTLVLASRRGAWIF